MKSIYKLLSALVVLAFVLSMSCRGDDPKAISLNEIAFEKLSGDWTLGTTGSIDLDGTNVSLNYPGFSFSFTDGTYATENAGDLFSAMGTWQWVGEEAKVFRLDSGEQVTILDLTETRFRFTFTSGGTGGEAAGIAGVYTIEVVK